VGESEERYREGCLLWQYSVWVCEREGAEESRREKVRDRAGKSEKRNESEREWKKERGKE